MSRHLAVIIGLVAWVVITLVLFYRLYRLEEHVSSDHYAPEWIVRVKKLETHVQVLGEKDAELKEAFLQLQDFVVNVADAQMKPKTLKGKKNA